MHNRSLRLTLAAMLGAAALPALAQPGAGASLPDSTGTGPFSSVKEIDPGLPDQVIYRPAELDALGDTKLGIYVFGNGACSDVAKIEHVPIAVANIDKGHGGTYAEPNGGAAAGVVVDWLEWQLRGDTEAGRSFVGANCGLCTDSEWEYAAKNFDLLD